MIETLNYLELFRIGSQYTLDKTLKQMSPLKVGMAY